jgi:tellurite resistance protein
VVELSRTRLEPLRDALRARGQRPSIILAGAANAELYDAMQLVDEWGPFVEAMYIIMASDRRVMNVEREVLRGALAVLSDEKVRTRHMEAMLDSATRNIGAEGVESRFKAVMEKLRQNPARAESAAVVGAAIAAADDRFPPEESAMLQRMMRELGIETRRAQELLAELEGLAKH